MKILILILCFSKSLVALEPVIFLFGPPGCGKGTFSQMAKEKGYNHLSTGDLIRHEIALKTPFGVMIEDLVKRGDYVDRVLLAQIMKEKIADFSSKQTPFIVDGYGRNPEDIQVLVDATKELNLEDRTLVLFFDADDLICKERISGRMVCNQCDQVYNIKTTSLQLQDHCEKCKTGVLEERINDSLAVIEKRMLEYRRSIEKSYRLSLPFFPALFFNSGQEREVCFAFYENLLRQIKAHQGNSKTFVEVFDPSQSL